MRKYLEREMLAECLRGHIRYGCTAYCGMDGSHIFEICVDGRQIKRFSWETVNTYFINNGYKKNSEPFGILEYWQDFTSMLNEFPIQARTEYTDDEFCGALELYRNQNIQQSIYSENPIIKMFAVLDRRIGRRTLKKIECRIKNQPDWLQMLYNLRIKSEQYKATDRQI